MWTVAHLVVHLPSGWPFPVPGEWDLLLPASVFADGVIPRRWLGGLGPHEAASALLSVLVAAPLALGLDPTWVARTIAMGFGALAAGSLAVLSWHAASPLEPSAPLDRDIRGLAAAITALWVATTLPSWHSEASALDGSTPEATALMLAGFALLVGAHAGPARPLAAGVLLALATLLSPVCAPGLAGGALFARARRLPWLVLGVAAVLAAAALLGSGAGASWVSLAGSAGTGSLAGDLRLMLPRALHAATAGLALRSPGSTALGVLTLLSLVAAATLVRPPGTARLLGLGALGFLALTLWTPESYRQWPTAYRYWQPALLLAAACVGPALARCPKRWRGLALLPILVFVLGPGRRGLPRIATLSESLFATGIHKLGPDPWSDHALLRELAPHAPLVGGEGLLLGYGLMVGQKASAQGMEAPFVSGSWDQLLASLPPAHAAALSVGVGYGLTAPCDPTDAQLALIHERPERLHVLYGIARGLAARGGPEPALDQLPRDEGPAYPRQETRQMDELGRFQPPLEDCDSR